MIWYPGMPLADRGDDASASDRSEPCPLCGGTVASLRVKRRGHAVSLSRAKLFPVFSVEVCDDLSCDYSRWQRADRASEARAR